MARLRMLFTLLATLLGLALSAQVVNADACTHDAPVTTRVGSCVSPAPAVTRPLVRAATAAAFTYYVPTVARVGAQEGG